MKLFLRTLSSANSFSIFQSSYFFLLRRYLESIFDGCEARSAYLHLLQKLQEVKKLNEGKLRAQLNIVENLHLKYFS